MTEQDYIEVKDLYIDHIKKYMTDAGGLFPHITILADHLNKEDDVKKAIIHIPIPGEYMNSEEGKDSFVEEIMPSIFKEVNKKFSPYGIAGASEAWVRIAGKDFNAEKGNWKALPIKKEVLFISIETEFKKEVNVYNIKRTGHKVNSDGELIDNISLEEENDFGNPESVGGRFSGLYKKLIKNETD